MKDVQSYEKALKNINYFLLNKGIFNLCKHLLRFIENYLYLRVNSGIDEHFNRIIKPIKYLVPILCVSLCLA